MPFSYFILKIYKSINQTIHNNQVKKTARPTTDLAQARSPRSSERSPLAQATVPLLGEIAIEALGGFSHARLGKPSSPEQVHSSPKGEVPRLGRNCSDTPPAPMRSRLGEHLSPERDSTSLKTKALRLRKSSSAG
ncbi:hypothetical protein DEO72_LG11g1987 [Vigna unguiculata]|uniref:Uncharacterized protein n=1 Tax=Vigna unguiculata TaxID=3917 RepID=A0A4D6NR57_VIGUN|nr:hypothetical protein DEO72_LG11g1987 [Vigna unguiculata]